MFEMYLLEQLLKHPSAQPQDVVKMCYQAAFGAEHLLADVNAARSYLEKEYSEICANDDPLYEELSEDICRVNLSAWKAANMPLDWLLRMFLDSATVSNSGTQQFYEYLCIAGTVIGGNPVAFSPAEWDQYLLDYHATGIHAVHHSAQYREHEKPAYRIINRKFTRILPILQRLSSIRQRNSPLVVAIDGRAGSGKTTLAGLIRSVTGADVIRMDDFFLPPALRTQERLAAPGGNIHYERFSEEVLPCLRSNDPFKYRIFDCGIMDYHGEASVNATPVRIVEGTYSCHPIFGTYADISVLSTVSPEEQLRRIRMRSGEKMLQMFQNRWIPMEEAYFSCYHIQNKSDIVIEE